MRRYGALFDLRSGSVSSGLSAFFEVGSHKLVFFSSSASASASASEYRHMSSGLSVLTLYFFFGFFFVVVSFGGFCGCELFGCFYGSVFG